MRVTREHPDLREDFRRQDLVAGLIEKIKRLAGDRRLRFMEVCGGHTAAMLQFGFHGLLPDNIELLSGPGCPVCVTSNEQMAQALDLASRSDSTLLTFGDMMRVPTPSGTLEYLRSSGASVEVVYSPMQCLSKAKKYPERQFIFLAIGFETTAPGTAVMLLKAREHNLTNLSILSGHKTMPEAMGWLVAQGEVDLDGFICPGHVSTIIGTRPYEFLAKDHGIPCAITGFEPIDLLYAVHSLTRQIVTEKTVVEDCYERSVEQCGNQKALEVLYSVFTACDAKWRGLGIIPGSGLRLSSEFDRFDAARNMKPTESLDHPFDHGCLCGEMLRGLIRPDQCPLFAKRCTPQSPVGPCMVSAEGSCNVYFRFKR